jgi:DNA (cytosine-5)-methyltransferase 1
MNTVLDLFSAACGGWSLGMHRAGFRTVAACEFVDWRRALYGENNPGVLIYDDVRTLTADRIVSDIGYFPRIVVGSPPCQDISSANTKGKGVEGERSGLFFEAIRIVREGRPCWVALENSSNLRTRGADRVIAELEALGYTVWAFVVGASDIGANHERKRAWIVAFDPAQVGHDGGRSWGHGPYGDGAAYPGDRRKPSHASEIGCARVERDYRQQWGESAEYAEIATRCDAGWGDEIAVADTNGDGRQSGWSRDRRWIDLRISAGIGRASQGYAVSDAAGDRWPAGRPGRCAEPDAELSIETFGADFGEMGGGRPTGANAGEPWPQWNSGFANHLQLDDGLSARVAGARIDLGSAKGTSAASLIVEAFGDAVVPQIPEAIGRAILRVEQASAAIYGRSENQLRSA